MYEAYRNRMEKKGKYLSDVLRYNSEAVVNATWMQSIAYRPVIVKRINSGLPEFDEDVDEILDAHFEQKSKYDIKGDEVAYWLRFRPRAMQEHSEIAIGSYVSIPDCEGDREIWLIAHIEDDGEQKWFQVLKCNWTYKWIYKGKIYEVLGCQRYSSSYNSGIYANDRTTAVENMNGFWLPTNDDTDKITYDQRFIINNGNRETPLCWSVSKIETTVPIGLSKFTVTQVPFDPEHDNATLGIANYYSSEFTPTPHQDPVTPQAVILTYTGTKPAIKVGGSAKTFTAQLPEDNNLDIMWSVLEGTNTYGNGTYDNETKTYGDYTLTTTDRALVLKVGRNYDLVGKILTIKAHCANGSEGTIQVEVIS